MLGKYARKFFEEVEMASLYEPKCNKWKLKTFSEQLEVNNEKYEIWNKKLPFKVNNNNMLHFFKIYNAIEDRHSHSFSLCTFDINVNSTCCYCVSAELIAWLSWFCGIHAYVFANIKDFQCACSLLIWSLSYNQAHNTLRIFNCWANFLFITSETKGDY